MGRLGQQHETARWQMAAAFAIVYIVWGSTYLGMKFAIQTMPPLMMSGIRFTLAGLLLYGYMRIVRGVREEPVHWLRCTLAGSLFFLVSNGTVSIGVKYIDSGIAALIIAMTSIWIVVIDPFMPNGRRPGSLAVAGFIIGLAGLYVLFDPTDALVGEDINVFGATIVLLGTWGWAFGTHYVRHARLPVSKLLAASMQMVGGGVGLTAAGLLLGEGAEFNIMQVSLISWSAFIYLLIFGSLIAFTTYNWLLKRTSAQMLGTIGYVNPVVALVVGVLIGGEHLGLRELLASLVILFSVILISRDRDVRRKATP